MQVIPINRNQQKATVNPLTDLGEALAAKWNGTEGYRKYDYDPETDTIISETGTGLHFSAHLKQVLGH